MRTALASLATVAALSAATPAQAQDEDSQIWTSTSIEFDLGEKTTFSGELVARFGEAADGVDEMQYQADVEYELSDRVSIGGGYSYVTAHDQGDITSREHRIRQQVSVKLGRLLGGSLESRVRLEQRWRDDGDDMLVRLRGRLSWTRPIGGDFSVRAWHESFVHVNDTDWNGPSRYARARQQIGLRRAFGERITGEIAYLNQYNLSGDADPDDIVHALSLAISFSL